jgi:hypothetical protein
MPVIELRHLPRRLPDRETMTGRGRQQVHLGNFSMHASKDRIGPVL